MENPSVYRSYQSDELATTSGSAGSGWHQESNLRLNGSYWWSIEGGGCNKAFEDTRRNALIAKTCHSNSSSYGGCEMRRKNATRESTTTLKNWLQEHIKNPYPSKGEKIMLAIITKMTLTQVSTWFANARRRLKKENKVYWLPRNRPNNDNNSINSIGTANNNNNSCNINGELSDEVYDDVSVPDNNNIGDNNDNDEKDDDDDDDDECHENNKRCREELNAGRVGEKNSAAGNPSKHLYDCRVAGRENHHVMGGGGTQFEASDWSILPFFTGANRPPACDFSTSISVSSSSSTSSSSSSSSSSSPPSDRPFFGDFGTTTDDVDCGTRAIGARKFWSIPAESWPHEQRSMFFKPYEMRGCCPSDVANKMNFVGVSMGGSMDGSIGALMGGASVGGSVEAQTYQCSAQIDLHSSQKPKIWSLADVAIENAEFMGRNHDGGGGGDKKRLYGKQPMTTGDNDDDDNDDHDGEDGDDRSGGREDDEDDDYDDGIVEETVDGNDTSSAWLSSNTSSSSSSSSSSPNHPHHHSHHHHYHNHHQTASSSSSPLIDCIGSRFQRRL